MEKKFYVFDYKPVKTFRNIYLGETFSSYVCVHNDSTETCRLEHSLQVQFIFYESNPLVTPTSTKLSVFQKIHLFLY
jgi:hypothetical protein